MPTQSLTLEYTVGSSTARLGSGEADDDGWGIDEISGSDLVLAMYSLICLVGVSGNLLVCVVLLRVKSLRSTTSHFLIHLSLVDLIVCILVVPFKIAPPLTQRLSGASSPPPALTTLPLQQSASPASVERHATFIDVLVCRFYVSQFIFWGCALTSVLSLVSVTLERFVAIVHPLRYKKIYGSRRNKTLMCVCCWVLGGFSQSFIIFNYSTDARGACVFVAWPSHAVQLAIGIANFLVSIATPFLFMVVVQMKTIATLKRQVRTLTGGTESAKLNAADRQQMWQLRTKQTLARTLLVFVLTFAVCWLPVFIIFLLYTFGVPVSFTSPTYHASVILAVCNSCVNPVIYTATNRSFRRGIRQLLTGERRSGQVGEASVTNPASRNGTAATTTEAV